MKNGYIKAKNNLKEFACNVYTVSRRPEMVILPGSIAFFFVLAILPSLGLMSSAASVLDLSVDYIYNFISNVFSTEIADIIFGAKIAGDAASINLITILIGIYIASNGADSIILASNTIYGIKNKNWFVRRIKAIFMTLLIIILLLFILIVPVFGNTIIEFIKEINISEAITVRILFVYEFLKGPISWIIIFIIIKTIYIIAPDKKRENRVINYGALFATLGWILGTKLFSIYVMNYADYSILYGGLASVVVFMIWVYYLSVIFSFGLALNYKKDEDKLLKNGNIKTNKK